MKILAVWPIVTVGANFIYNMPQLLLIDLDLGSVASLLVI